MTSTKNKALAFLAALSIVAQLPEVQHAVRSAIELAPSGYQPVFTGAVTVVLAALAIASRLRP